jgi:uncharacterized protein (TIGR02099 family)
MTAALRYLLRKFYLLCAITLIAVAVLVQAGRMFSPIVSDYRDDLAAYVGAQLNAQVELGAITAKWEGLKPVLDIKDLRISSHSDEPIFQVGQARVRLDLLRSLANFHLVWGTVNLQHTQLEFEQTATGLWRIPGLPQAVQNAPEAAQLDLLIDTLLLSNTIKFERTRLIFHFVNGHQIALDSPSVLLENRGNFHRLSLAIDIETRKQAVSLVLEGQGDPRDQAHFNARGYLALNDFPTSEPLAAASALLLGEITERHLRSEGALNGKLWFNTRPGNDGFNISGQLALQTLVVPLLGRQYKLDSFSTGIEGHWLRTGAWALGLPDMHAGLQDTRIEQVNLAVSSSGHQAPLKLQLDKLQLSLWVDVLTAAGVMGEGRINDIVTGLAPGGTLNNLLVTLPLREPANWQIEANAEQLSVTPWRGVPGFTGVDGYIKAGQGGGFINIESRAGFSMHFDPTFQDAMQYQEVSGQVAWHLRPEDNVIYVNSGAIRFINGAEDATGYLWLSLPWRYQTGDTDLYLHIGARNLQASLYPKYLPARIPESLTHWLASSIGANNPGYVSEGGFIFRGTLSSPHAHAKSHQLYLNINDADLAFHADWPELHGLDGRLLLNDSDVDASITSGTLFSSEILPTRIATGPNPDGDGALLTINGKIQASAADGFRVVRESPLRRYMGNNFDDWRVAGDITGDINLAVPLAPDAGGAAQRIDLALSLPTLELNNFRLAVHNVQGNITYDSTAGLSSENLQGELFDQPVAVVLGSLRDEQVSQTHINITGAVATEKLAAWTNRPEILFLNGTLPYSTDITLHHRSLNSGDDNAITDDDRVLATLAVKSDLADVRIDLPSPLGKSARAKRSLEVSGEIREQTASLLVNYHHKKTILTQSRFLIGRADQRLLKANIAVGELATLPLAPQFRISGSLPSLDLGEWRKVGEDYRQYRESLPGQGEGVVPDVVNVAPGQVAGLPIHTDLTLVSQELGPLQLKNLSLKAWQQDAAWQVEFANPILSGKLQVPLDKTRAMRIDVNELHLDRGLLGGSSGTLAEAPLPSTLGAVLTEEAIRFHPRDLPRADLTVAALFVDGSNYGNWSLEVYPESQGVLIDNIRGNIRGINVSGIRPHEENIALLENPRGAQIYWSEGEQGIRTRFIGSLTAGDMADVLRAWQKPDIIESRAASYKVDLAWPGAPGEFALADLNGDIDLLLQEGRFKRETGAGEGILRLLSLVNFDSLARRLRLDFSDLYKGGLAYDQVQGKMRFEGGKIFFEEPLLVQSPSSRLQMGGSINLHDETINTRLIAAIPVAGNLTFLAAFATGLPAAAGIYLISKIFRKQVDQATSVSYRISGSWDDPQMKFDRLFESETSLRTNADEVVKDAPEAPPESSIEPALPSTRETVTN